MGVAALALTAAAAVVGATGATYDASAHRLEARGAAAADLRAPSAQVARVRAERTARRQAERKISEALVVLGSKRSTEELAKLLETATVSEERFGSDGSVELTLTLSTAEISLGGKKR